MLNKSDSDDILWETNMSRRRIVVFTEIDWMHKCVLAEPKQYINCAFDSHTVYIES